MRTRKDPTPDSHAFPTRPYDLVKEFCIALGAVMVIVVVLAAVFGSPDEPAVTYKQWAAADPADLVATTAAELAGSSTTAGYGPPYNTASDGQSLGPLTLQKWGGVTTPVDATAAFVIDPLTSYATDPATLAALKQWKAASPDQQTAWASAYSDALSQAPDNDPAKVAAGDYGPVPQLCSAEVTLAATGMLEGRLTTGGAFYGADSTRPLLFLADGGYIEGLARAQHLGGDQWGMMNETGNYPGQPWLWLYTFWYQIPPFSTSENADVLVFAIVGVLSLAFMLLPWIPGLNRLPRYLGVHRLIWRDWHSRTRR